jgi:uncharacterized membrane protein
MMRQKIAIPFAILVIVALTANASDFWQTEGWQKWSKDGCQKLLTDSPWAHTWSGVYAANLGPHDRLPGLVPSGNKNDIFYTIQMRSSLPIREALIREQQLSQNYDKMNADKRKAFDAWTAQELGQKPDDPILVRVDLTKGAAFSAFDETGRNLNLSLVTDDGTRIGVTRVEFNRLFRTFDATFPRSIDGVPTIKDGQKYFSIEFQSPQVLVVDGLDIPIQPEQVMTPAQSVQVKFDLSKMIVDGKPNY